MKTHDEEVQRPNDGVHLPARLKNKKNVVSRINRRPGPVKCHFDGSGAGKAGFAHNELGAAALVLAEMHIDEPVDHFPLAASDAGHIGAHLSCHHTQAGLWVDEGDSLGAVNDVLAGKTGNIRARAADHRPFDHDRRLAAPRQGPGHELPTDAAADHQVLIVFDAHDGSPFRCP